MEVRATTVLEVLYPDIYVDSVLDIPVEQLRSRNVTSYILDLDNTMTEWNSSIVTPAMVVWIKGIKEQGGKTCIVSNNSEKRVVGVAEALEIPYVCRAGKPRRRAFQRALAKLEAVPRETAVVGDQVFTDILGGNLMGMVTILVSPINKREFLGTRVMRQVEKLVLIRIKARAAEGQWPSFPSDPHEPG